MTADHEHVAAYTDAKYLPAFSDLYLSSYSHSSSSFSSPAAMTPCYYKCIALLLAFSTDAARASTFGSFLSDTLVRDHPVQDVLEYHPSKHTECRTPPTGPIEMTHCDYEQVETASDDLFANLQELVKTPFFKYFQVDLYRDCPFWEENGACGNRECAITTVDESDVPEKWRAAALSQIEQPPSDKRTRLPGCYYRDSDFCFLDDMTEGEYFDLTQVPERFTGYSGPSAHRVWRTIYEENCFGLSEMNLMKAKSPAPISMADPMTEALHDDGSEPPAQCLEKRVYYKIISGLHASISTHICYDYLNQKTGEWGPNLQCFIERVASHPERLQYIYFDVVLMLRAVARLGPYLDAYDYCSTGTHEEDVETKRLLGNVVDIAKDVGKFDESVLFRGENAKVLKEEFKNHFRNVTRIMDCVECHKCRLWGKVQTTGIATALKILFEMDEKTLDPRANANLLSRSEVVALINTLHRLSESLEVVDIFRTLWNDTSAEDTEQLLSPAEPHSQYSHSSPKTPGALTPDTPPPPRAATPPQPSPPAGSSYPPSLLDTIKLNLARWGLRCKNGTFECLAAIVEYIWRGGDFMRGLFRLSGKENGPGFDEL